MGNERFYLIFNIFLVLNSFWLDPDLYQSSAWIRNQFFQIQDPDPYQIIRSHNSDHSFHALRVLNRQLN